MLINPILQGLKELAHYLGGKLDTLTAVSSIRKLDTNLWESTKQLEVAAKELAVFSKVLSKKESIDYVGLTGAVINALVTVNESVRKIKLDIPKDGEIPNLLKEVVRTLKDKDMIVEAPDFSRLENEMASLKGSLGTGEIPNLLKEVVQTLKDKDMIVEAPNFSGLENEVAGLKKLIGVGDLTKIESKIGAIYDCIEKLNTTMQALKFPTTIKLDEMQLKALRGSMGGGGISMLGGGVGAPVFATMGVGNKAVATAGTAVVLAAVTACAKVEITAFETNTGVIVVGNSSVVAAVATRKGTPLGPGNTLTLNIHNLAKIYIDSTVSGDSVSYTYYN